MLSPDLPGVAVALAVAFVLLLALLVWRAVRKDRREYQRFKRYRSTERRQAMFRRWLRESFLSFGSLAVVLLVLVWQFVPRLLDDVNGWASVRGIRSWYDSLGWLGPALTVTLVLVFVVLPMLLLFFVSKQDDVTAIGDIQAMLPRNTAEVRLGSLLSLNAGVVEELVFRLALPSLVYGAFGSASVAILVPVLLFGALHAYQGPVGIIGTMLVGSLLMALYVATGTILVPIVAHVLIDLRSFVLIPLIVLKVPRYPVVPPPAAP